MDKSEAMRRLDAIEAEAKELRRIINGPEIKVGMFGKFWDSKSEPGNQEALFGFLSRIDDDDLPYRRGAGACFYHFRPVAKSELFPEEE